MLIRTKFMKKTVSKIITKELKKRGYESNVDIDELELELGKKPVLHVNLRADIRVDDLFDIIGNIENEE